MSDKQSLESQKVQVVLRLGKEIKRRVRNLVGRARRLCKYVLWRLRKSSHESVYLYTFHKCASSLFEGFVLKNVEGLRHVNYEGMLYLGKETGKIDYQEKGYAYGPIRLSYEPHVLIHCALYDPESPDFRAEESATSTRFVADKCAVFLVRDPRDILVSEYYSYAFSHGFTEVAAMRGDQEERVKKIQEMGVDEYVRTWAPRLLGDFEVLRKLSEACDRKVVLRYEDMVDNWEHFISELTSRLPMNQSTIEQLYRKTRPRETEDKKDHRRSGKSGQFGSHLTPETVAFLNETFGEVIERFRYDV